MSFFEDLRFGARMLTKDPKFTAVVVLALALGIGANTTVFTLVNAVLFRGLPFEQPDRIMHIASTRLSRGNGNMGVSYPDFKDWRAQTKTFQDLGAFSLETTNLSDQGNVPERYSGGRLTANTFALIGQKPMLGRDFLPDEDKPGSAAVVILGHGIWKTRYGKDPGIIGRPVRINDIPATVVGVMPEGMKFPLNEDLWMPLIPVGEWEKRDAHDLNVFGRLKAGATLADARAEIEHFAKTLEKDYPKTNQGIGAVVKSYNEVFNGGQIRIIFLALLGAVGFVLLIACANVANLLLSRSLARAKEVSIRTALGASRWRVVRQLLIESVLLGILGGVVGLLFSIWGVKMFDLAVADVGKPYWIKFTMDFAVFGYLAAVCLTTGLLFGLAPALHMSKVDINRTLKEGTRGSGGSSRMKYLSGTLVVGELALALVLLAGAGLMIRSFMKLYDLDPGVNPNNVLTMHYVLNDAKYPTADARVHFEEQLLPSLSSVAGVESVALTSSLPLRGTPNWRFEIEGQPPVEKEKRQTVSGIIISPDYFRVLGIDVLRGRVFNSSDGLPGKTAVIVNQRFATKYWPKEDALGKRVRLTRDSGEHPWLTVLGVCPDIKQGDFNTTEAEPIIYVPYRQDAASGVAIMARSKVPPASLTSSFRKQVQALDSNLPLYRISTLLETFVEQRWPFRVFGTLFAVFALIALVLSSVGIYAVMSYAVSQRTQEIGIRMALGASTGSVMRLVLSLGAKQLAIGLLAGLALAFGVTRVLASLLVQTTPTDPLTFTAIVLLLVSVAFIACWIPARRAMRVDPLVALRYE
jgi:putative ABC transport system permease protein